MDVVADALTRLRNAVKVNKKEVALRQSKAVHAIVDILLKEGFLVSVADGERDIVVELAFDGPKPVMTGLTRISKSGNRIYVNVSELKNVMGGRGIGIVTTSKGIMTIDEARRLKLGGEYICEVW